jgi:hypothetical protein
MPCGDHRYASDADGVKSLNVSSYHCAGTCGIVGLAKLY